MADASRQLRRSSILAASLSKNSKDRSLVSYVTWLSDEHPALYVSLLGRLVPVEAKVKTDFERPQRLNMDMPLSEMISAFEQKIKSDYRPRMIDLDDDGGGDE